MHKKLLYLLFRDLASATCFRDTKFAKNIKKLCFTTFLMA